MPAHNFLRELKRRHVYRVAVAYAVVGWLLVEVATQVFPVFHIPDWAAQLVVLLIAIGFPIAVVLAWAFEMTPEGVRRTEPVDSPAARPSEHAHRIGKHLNAIIIGVLALAVAALLWQRYGPDATPGSHGPTAAQATRSGMTSKSATGSPSTISSKSIAVLPFVNMSADPTQDYFSDGIAEELLNRLAQLPDLKVAARTSAFQFKGKNEDIGEIGRKLNVSHVLEGSVRKSGTTLRITAQLIDSRSGYHMWSETYDRDASDIFKVQDEIAGAIADALEARIGGQSTATVQARVTNPAAYDNYLQGRTFVARRQLENLDKAIAAFDRAIAQDDGYSAAYSGRAFAYLLRPLWNGGDWGAALRDARASAEQALRLDQDNAEAYMVRGMVASFSHDPAAARVDLDRAKVLAPGSVDVLNMDGDFRTYSGALGAAEREKRQAMALDPLAFVHPLNLADILTAQGRYAEAAAAADQAIALGIGSYGYDRLVLAYSRLGRVDATRAAVEKSCAIKQVSNLPCMGNRAQLLVTEGRREEAKTLADKVALKLADDPTFDPALISGVYAEIGDIAKATQYQRSALDKGSWFVTNALLYAPGGAKLPEEISRDPDWLAVWADPRIAKVTADYRRNLLAWRAAAKAP